MRKLLRARGISPAEADAEIARVEAQHGSIGDMLPERVAEVFQITFAEMIQYEVKTVRVVNPNPGEVAAYLADRRARDRERKRLERAQQRQQAASLSAVEADVLRVLERGLGRRRRLPDLIEEAARWKSLKKANGRSKSPEARKAALHRAADKLVKRQLIGQRFDEIGRGLKVRLVWRA